MGLWVVLDDQFQDAIELKGNSSHRPSVSLSEDEMAEIEALGQNHFEDSGAKILSAVGYTAAVMVLVGYILYVLYGLLNPP